MNSLTIKQSPEVKLKFQSYPKEARMKLDHLRQLIIDTASDIDYLDTIHETLKWGEPSYLVKKGSTIRMDWKAKNPEQYAMYFICNTSLVETFQMVYGSTFKYEGNRAIVFDMKDELPEKELRECIRLALQYHTLKDKPFLGQ